MSAVMRRVCFSNQLYKHQLAALSSLPLSTTKHSIHSSPWRYQSSDRDPPPSKMKVMYIPNPFKWLNNRMDIANLKRDFDPNFNEEDFKVGAKQAVCTVTELVHKREWGDLKGLITQKMIDKLRKTKWTADQIHNLVLSPDNVQVVQFNDIKLQSIVADSEHGTSERPCYRKYCDIDVIVIGTCIPYNQEKHSIILLEYFARFHREYTEGKLPEWTITNFKLQNFQAVPRR
ncbi:m-AAA protease-interacting protein 1, mitochondrial-like isoform X1 [Penaeus japonicus]|uniref:m-AAA protease-interacting protein 1, mitochondrial-like isoform X1 n=1 Tax=Penaeus japonicus TaxID=27405 RepID=UPI001C712048|nr:m-AAA protease-interacting protein 1, mitochondrial-like isoform X1 [Penaeus japonicus]XP_042863373.1 m-AAA protease-interacting protein 1, mitochondrial-like isoform X1 [Penaeus japonicus]XP_042863381.1 m-AAA protease-interacting protein 1, mitochondrial-like isoform X1 [Penaeus japonicus]XP_042863389.1 m-AAA protease-interacting protein 1, mitochondrial-like isoform X1 [Penaeus japonicus]XP_042863396.1 m-AAA protease-interacting protein 1, mitochondrial-like isoform X1 [Penaeus japonicus]